MPMSDRAQVEAPVGAFPALTIQAPQPVQEALPSPTYTLMQVCVFVSFGLFPLLQ